MWMDGWIYSSVAKGRIVSYIEFPSLALPAWKCTIVIGGHQQGKQ